MRWTLLAALLVACRTSDSPQVDAAASTDKPATRTLFTKAAPAVGAKRQESSELTMTLAMQVDGRATEMNVRESVKRTEEILAVTGDAVTKAKVVFDSVQSTGPSAIAGKTFVVEAKDGKIDVRDEQGKPASPADAKEVEKHMKNLGKADPMLAALPASGVVPGQKVDAIARAISDQLKATEEGMTANDVVVTFKEQRGDDGIFDVALKLTKDEGATKMVIAVKGDAWVSTKTGWSTKMDLAGPVTIAGGQLMKTEGAGKMTMKMETKTL